MFQYLGLYSFAQHSSTFENMSNSISNGVNQSPEIDTESKEDRKTEGAGTHSWATAILHHPLAKRGVRCVGVCM